MTGCSHQGSHVWSPDTRFGGVALLWKTAPGHRLSEQLSQHVYVCWPTHSVELRSGDTAPGTCQWTKQKTLRFQNRYKMIWFKELWYRTRLRLGPCSFHYGFPSSIYIFKSSALVSVGLRYAWPKKSSLVITCCLLVLKTLTRYNLDVNAGAHVSIYLCLSSCTDKGCIDDRVISIMVSPFQYTFPSPLLLLLLTPVFFCSNMLLFGRNTELSSIKPDDHLI